MSNSTKYQKQIVRSRADKSGSSGKTILQTNLTLSCRALNSSVPAKFLSIMLLMLWCSFASAQTIESNFDQNYVGTLCPGNEPAFYITITGTFNSDNVFTAQLSDASGSFASPANIGTREYPIGGWITVVIPDGTPAGNGYRIRVVSSDPVIIGSDNGSDLVIYNLQTWYLDSDNDGHYLYTAVHCGSPGAGWTLTAGTSGDCNDGDNTQWQYSFLYLDNDGDGYNNSGSNLCYGATIPTGYSATTLGYDCDDNNAAIHSETWYYDYDGDGHDIDSFVYCGSMGAGWTLTKGISGDCNDYDNTQWQSGSLYIDLDGDGYDHGTATICYGASAPAGYSATTSGSDCDDLNGSAHEALMWYSDLDNDGYYASSWLHCGNPGTGWNLTGGTPGDCYDYDNTQWQMASFYIDQDGDGYDNGTEIVCSGTSAPSGYSATTLGPDCNDDPFNGGTTAHEVLTWYMDQDYDGHTSGSFTDCFGGGAGYTLTEGISGDCDDQDSTKWQVADLYRDVDGDGYDNGIQQTCIGVTIPWWLSFTTLGSDCNDQNAAIHPGVSEVCNNYTDDNCNGQVDENCAGYTYYADVDQDTYGNSASSISSGNSTPPAGYVADNTDCNDNDATVHAPQLYYADADLDGYGSTTTAMLCSSTAPTGYSTNNTDCNDNDATVHVPQSYYADADHDSYGSTATAMLCSSTTPTGYSTNSTDCNDNDATVHTPQSYYIDADQDGHGSTTTVMVCSSTAPAGYSTNNTDCNDNDAMVHTPQSYYVDADQDSYGSTTTAMLCSSTAPAGYSTNNTDCDDSNAAINPGVTEVCSNGADDNCNGQIDENCAVYTYYADVDQDTYGDLANSITSNSNTPPAGYVTDNTDCNDNDATVHTPQLYYIDADEDGYGSTTTAMVCSSAPPAGYSINSDDCNDSNASVNPPAPDICNGVDDNCNGTLDENTLIATVTPGGTVTYCRNIPVTLSANTGSGITYQWYKGTALQSGATNSTFTTTKRGSFRVVETTGFCTSTSAYTSVARLAIPQSAIIVYGNTDICNTGSVTLRGNNAGNNDHTYQWNKSGRMIIGATDRLYTATTCGDYTVTVINSNSCATTSAPVTVSSSCKETQQTLFSAKLNLYPNPTNGSFNVELKIRDDVSAEADVQIMNEFGQSIYLDHAEIVNGKLFVEIKLDQSIPGGNYFIRILAGNKIYTGKIVYQK